MTDPPLTDTHRQYLAVFTEWLYSHDDDLAVRRAELVGQMRPQIKLQPRARKRPERPLSPVQQRYLEMLAEWRDAPEAERERYERRCRNVRELMDLDTVQPVRGRNGSGWNRARASAGVRAVRKVDSADGGEADQAA